MFVHAVTPLGPKVGEPDKESNLIANYHLFLYLPRIMRLLWNKLYLRNMRLRRALSISMGTSDAVRNFHP